MLVDLIGEYTFKTFVEDHFEMNWSECETQENKNVLTQSRQNFAFLFFASEVLVKKLFEVRPHGCATCELLLLRVLFAASLKRLSWCTSHFEFASL